MASKRLKKKRLRQKQAKQQQQALLQKAGYSPKEQKRMAPTTRKQEVKRLERNAREVQRVQENRQKLLNDNIPLSIITAERLDRKGYSKLTKKQIADARLRGQKLEALKAKGITYSKAKSDLSLSWDKLRLKYGLISDNKLEKGRVSLYVGLALKEEGFYKPNYKDIPTTELMDMIRERYRDAIKNPDGSASFKGVYVTYVGNEADTKAISEDYFRRGYRATAGGRRFKTDADSYQKITCRNDFTQRSFYEMIYTCITQMRNDSVPGFMHGADGMERFCEENGWTWYRDLNL